jgi:hypothetical protein
MYELTAADAASTAAAGTSLDGAVITPEVFVTIAIVMSVGIVLGGILCVIGLKKYSGILKGKPRSDADNNAEGLTETDSDISKGKIAYNAEGLTEADSVGVEKQAAPTKKKKKLNFSEMGNIVSASIFIALCSAYIGGAVGRAFGGFHIDSYTSVVPFVSMLIAVGCMAFIGRLQKKHAWLQSFSLSFSMLIGMISAIPVSLVLGAVF